MRSHRDGRLTVVVGASRSGKTQYVLHRIARVPRLLVWDPKDEYSAALSGMGRCDPAAFAQWCTETRIDLRVACIPRAARTDFELFCRAAWHYARFSRRGTVLVVEELADVSHAGKAPDAWGTIIRQALGYGVDVFAITQRPQESDKTALGNASTVVCCRLARARDRDYMAQELDCDVAKIAALGADATGGAFLIRHAGGPAVVKRQAWSTPRNGD